MAHLKKAGTGHLYKGPNGHLVKDCGAVPENTCNDCDPPIPDTLYATMSGLAADFNWANGKHTLEWATECQWFYFKNDDGTWPLIRLKWYPDVPIPGWYCRIEKANGQLNCNHYWRVENDDCTPVDSYVFDGCNDNGCNDSDACEDSVGATCVVSTS